MTIASRRPLSAIFIDLDETLIHTRVRSDFRQKSDLVEPIYFGPYAAWLRPCTRGMLGLARSKKVPVILCTTAEFAYAAGLSTAFGLGFSRNQILASEHLFCGKSGLCPHGLLIDDLPAEHDAPRLKRHFLGIGAERHFQVAPFDPEDACDEHELIDDLSAFLTGFGSKKQQVSGSLEK